MSSLTQVEDVAGLSDAGLEMLLDRCEREEREVSRRRSRVHSRLDFVAAGGFASAAEAADQLAALQASEREISDRRRVLHLQIAELRAERSRRQAKP